MVDKRRGARSKSKSKSIHPLDGGYGGYIETLEVIRSYVDSKSTLTKKDLKSWYVEKYGPGNADSGIGSLFRSGLLEEGDGRIKCMFPQGKVRRNRRIVEIINTHVIYILDMLNEARDGATEQQLHELGKSKYGLSDSSNINHIRWRRGWLESAQVLERRAGRHYATDLGRKILDEHFDRRMAVDVAHDVANDTDVTRAEFGGKGEGPNHKTLKKYVHKVAEKICEATVKGRRVEYLLKSGDKVDVTAWNARNIWHIEVKSRTSQDQDIERGLYQCVKYDAVGKAIVKADDSGKTVNSLIVVETEPSQKVRRLAGKLGVRIYILPDSMKRELKTLRANHK